MQHHPSWLGLYLLFAADMMSENVLPPRKARCNAWQGARAHVTDSKPWHCFGLGVRVAWCRGEIKLACRICYGSRQGVSTLLGSGSLNISSMRQHSKRSNHRGHTAKARFISCNSVLCWLEKIAAMAATPVSSSAGYQRRLSEHSKVIVVNLALVRPSNWLPVRGSTVYGDQRTPEPCEGVMTVRNRFSSWSRAKPPSSEVICRECSGGGGLVLRFWIASAWAGRDRKMREAWRIGSRSQAAERFPKSLRLTKAAPQPQYFTHS